MSKRRARITEENDPLSQTDAVLVAIEQASQPESQEPKKTESQQVNKLTIRKATFQLSEALLDRLETYHLHLQLDLGKANTPYKEVIVEEAISQFLDQEKDGKNDLVALLQERQQSRLA